MAETFCGCCKNPVHSVAEPIRRYEGKDANGPVYSELCLPCGHREVRVGFMFSPLNPIITVSIH